MRIRQELAAGRPEERVHQTSNGAVLGGTGWNAVMMAKLGAELAKLTDADAVKGAPESFKPPSPFPLMSLGPNSEFGSYSYSATNHFSTLLPSAFVRVTPGTYHADGLDAPDSS
jgi:hypothetical protein